MARGWESKSVEDQIQSASTKLSVVKHPKQKSDQELNRVRTRQGLELMRSRVKQQIEKTQSERYLEMLRNELSALEQQISELS